MKRYTITLLKDLPTVKAGFTFTTFEITLKKYHYFKSQINKMTDDEFNEKVHNVLKYKDNNEWVKIEPDLSDAIKIQCPKCNNMGMFPYYPNENDVDYYNDGTLILHTKLGFECPYCNHILFTHSVNVNKKI